MNLRWSGLWALLPAVALASVGKVDVVEEATRIPAKGAPVNLTVGMPIELRDKLVVKKGGLKLTLNDESVIMLSAGSTLEIREADFAGQERRFEGFLGAGSLWTRVKKLLGIDSKFEVKTDRAVAGVRGTIFRIDADALVTAAGKRGGKKPVTVVRVDEGTVRVNPSPTLVAMMQKQPAAGTVGKRVDRQQVPGPSEVGVDEWDKRFVELQKGTQITVGVDIWEQAQLAEAAQNDAFAKWIESHQ